MKKLYISIVLIVSSAFSLSSCIIMQKPSNNSPKTTVFTSPDISTPQWSYDVFNANKDEGAYKLIEGPNFDQQNRQVKWVVDYSVPLPDNASAVQRQIAESLERVELANGFKAEFKDRSGVVLETVNLEAEGEGNRKRYTLRIPESVWQRWSEVARVNIVAN